MVTPKVLPLPFGLATICWAVGQVALVFHVLRMFAGEGTFMVTVQLLDPLTATLRLYRSLQLLPADSVAVQLPVPGVPGSVVVPPTVMLELPLL